MTLSAMRVALGATLHDLVLVGLGFLVREEQTSGTDGGTSAATTDNIREITSQIVNTISGASFIGSDDFTLPAGTYDVWSFAPTLNIGLTRCLLYNKTDSAIELIGFSEFDDVAGGSNSGGISYLNGQFTIAGEKTFDLQQYTETARTAGLGASASGGFKEVYGSILFREVSTVQDLLHIREEQTANTAGGSSSVGVQTRVLNTVVTNNISGASLSSNQIILGAGDYEIEAYAPCHRGNRHRAYLYNITDAADEVVGSPHFAWNSASTPGLNRSQILGRFTLAGTKTLEIRHDIAAAKTTDGLGIAVNDTRIEIYTDVRIREIVDDFDLLHVREEQTANTPAGASSVGINVRVLNTVKTNEISGASLASDTITLPAGTYQIAAWAPIFASNLNKIALRNKSAPGTPLISFGVSVFTDLGNNAHEKAPMLDQFIIDEETDFENVHQV